MVNGGNWYLEEYGPSESWVRQEGFNPKKTTFKDKLFPKSDDIIVHFGEIYGDNIEWETLEWNVVNDDKKRDGDTSNVWCYWFQNERISMPWIVTTKHVISCSGSVWNGLRCNGWIASNDLLREKGIYS